MIRHLTPQSLAEIIKNDNEEWYCFVGLTEKECTTISLALSVWLDAVKNQDIPNDELNAEEIQELIDNIDIY